MSASPRHAIERGEQAAIVQLLKTLGAQVYTLGTVRRRNDSHHGTMMTAGLPDVLAFIRNELLVIEVKAKGGRLRPEQERFRECCLNAGLAHIVGGLDAVIEWMQTRGYLAEERVK